MSLLWFERPTVVLKGTRQHEVARVKIVAFAGNRLKFMDGVLFQAAIALSTPIWLLLTRAVRE
jgi:hypothetical protein